ncbi:radical SAM protein [Pseudoalteromonas xiamenensis]|uniref:radical SAM/SPASM domain-containing protein n=1 Tax=Pseudoalteromonas xiamenensis TaxID=882626 RepID=UPI0027E3FFDD|nr:radical SAM protein [Pseudoalteromonas xiamenensis]WMN60565.1 radical SAM protein [Pseudoalteromonas xiamenensis]
MKYFGKLAHVEHKNGQYYLQYLPTIQGEVGPRLPLHPLVVFILIKLDEQKTVAEVVSELTQSFDISSNDAQEITDDVDVVFERHFSEQTPDPERLNVDKPMLMSMINELRTLGEFKTRNTVFIGNRSPFPLTLQWLVTDYCNRKCVYCYQGAPLSSKASDSIVDENVIKRLIREAAQLGTKEIFLTGGEPLLREGIYDIIVYALEQGLTPDFVTKQFINEHDAQKMAKAGLKDAYLSIDSLEKDSASELTGIGGFARKISQSVQNLVSAGIRVHAKSLLTSINAHAYKETLELLESLGASSITIDTYSDNLQRHDDKLRASTDQLQVVQSIVDDFKASNPDLTVYYRSDFSVNDLNYDIDGFICHNGRTQLLFYPNGDISKCDKKLPGGDMIVGSVLNQSVFDAWYSDSLLESLDPPREKYKGTPCFSCDYFDTCNIRGRCYYGAYMSTGTLYGPQEGACKFMVGVKSVC